MMTSIWGWLIQTIEVSVVAVMILFLKKLFQDKLPPKWQYGIWIILLLSLLLPAGMFGTSIVPTCRTYIEAIKTIVETSLQSAYVDVYLPIKNSFFFLFIIALPKSLTDYLFIVYISGGLFYLGRYCYQYYRLRTLLTLKDMGLKDIGFGCTVSNNNSKDMLSLYQLSKSLGMEFATAAFHNSYYFHKDDNVITNKDEVCKNFEQLIEWQLKENHPKSWFRAFFNMGLINYIEGGRRMLPCEAGSANFFIEPYGDVYPCNGLEEKYWMKKMGNIRETPNFMTIWESEQAQQVRDMVRKCPKNCWMVGTASPVMHKYIKHPLKWAIANKLRSMQGKSACLDKCWYNVGQDPCQGDLREKF